MNNKKVFPLKYAAKLLLYFVIAKGMEDFNTANARHHITSMQGCICLLPRDGMRGGSLLIEGLSGQD